MLLQRIYHFTIGRYREVVSFLVLISFLITFIVTRATVYMMDARIIPDFYLALGQTHVHHLNYGIFLLAIVGYLALLFHDEDINEVFAIGYGIGLGLTFDEFALWLHLQDDYSARVSYEAVIIISMLLINIVYFGDLWKRLLGYFLAKIQGRKKEKV
jgi:hypothetical protein